MYIGVSTSDEVPDLDDGELIARAQDGNVDAYEELVRRYQQVAYRTAFLITRSRADAEDVAQSAFIKAYNALRRFTPGSAFRPWLLAIVANEGRNHRRWTFRHRGFSLRMAEDLEAPGPEEAVLAREPGLLHAVNRLREEDRLVIVYRYFLDLSEAEMAKALGVARGTVKSRLSRALSRLRGLLEATGETVVAVHE